MSPLPSTHLCPLRAKFPANVYSLERSSTVFADILATYFYFWGGSASGQLLLVNVSSSNKIIVALRNGSLPLGSFQVPVSGDDLDKVQDEGWYPNPTLGNMPVQAS